MVGTNGNKFPAIRKHLDEKIAQVYADMDVSLVMCRVLILYTLTDLKIQELPGRRHN